MESEEAGDTHTVDLAAFLQWFSGVIQSACRISLRNFLMGCCRPLFAFVTNFFSIRRGKMKWKSLVRAIVLFKFIPSRCRADRECCSKSREGRPSVLCLVADRKEDRYISGGGVWQCLDIEVCPATLLENSWTGSLEHCVWSRG